MMDDADRDLYDSTQGLTTIGRRLHPDVDAATAHWRSAFVRFAFYDAPRVKARRRLPASIDRAATDRAAVALEKVLQRAWRGRLELVYPHRLLAWFELDGMTLEPVGPERVSSGEVLMAGLPRDDDSLTGGEEPEVARRRELYEFALAGIEAPRGGGSSPVGEAGSWQLAWRLTAEGGTVIELAARIELAEAVIAFRGHYGIAGAYYLPDLASERNELVVEVRSSCSRDRAVFWLNGVDLAEAIEVLHLHILEEEFNGRPGP